MFKRLSTRFIIGTFHVIIVSSLLSFIIANVYYHMTLKEQNDTRITNTLITQKKYIESHPEIKPDAFFTQLANLNFQVVAIKDGKKHFYGTPFRVKNLQYHGSLTEPYHGIKERPFNVFITGFFDNETRNTVGMPMQVNGERYDVYIRPDVGESMHEFRIFLAILFLCIIVFSILFVFLSSKYIVHPVVQLKEAARKIGDQSGYQTSVKRKDEIGVLAHEMNVMSAKILHHEEMNQRFVANVSHEIQSPITNLLGQIKQLRQTKDFGLMDDIEHQSQRLSGLTKQLLMLASLEKSGGTVEKELFSSKLLIQEVIRNHMYALDQKEIFVTTKLKDFEMSGHRDLCYQMLSNILSNAIKYSPVETQIKFESNNEGLPYIKVIDEGYGMSDKTKAYLFERFYKAEVHEDKVPSNGLGMAIVKEIADLHDFTIAVESEFGKGTAITIYLLKK